MLHTDVDTLGHDAAADNLVHDDTHGVRGHIAAKERATRVSLTIMLTFSHIQI